MKLTYLSRIELVRRLVWLIAATLAACSGESDPGGAGAGSNGGSGPGGAPEGASSAGGAEQGGSGGAAEGGAAQGGAGGGSPCPQCPPLRYTTVSCDDKCVYECVDGADECDDDASNGCEPEAFCEDHRLVFVTSEVYHGALGGLTGADLKCQALAEAAGRKGEFLAWLSDDNASPSTRFSQPDAPYLLADGTVVAQGWDGLTSGALLHAITLDEHGEEGPSADLEQCIAPLAVWSGTAADGTALASHCEGWKDIASPLIATGHRGAPGTGWTDQCYVEAGQSAWCAGEAPFYCFEQ